MDFGRLRLAFDRGLFDVGAEFYGWMTWQRTWRDHCGSLAAHFQPPRQPPGASLRVLDLGIGPGVSGLGILDRRPDVTVVGLDVSRRMLRLARGYIGRSGARVGLVRADALHLPFAAAAFDVVTHHSFLYLLPDRHRMLDEVRRVLRPGGRYVLLEPHRRGRLGSIPGLGGNWRFKLSMFLWRVVSRSYGQFEREELHDLLSGHGFDGIRIEETLGGLGLLGRASRAA